MDMSILEHAPSHDKLHSPRGWFLCDCNDAEVVDRGGVEPQLKIVDS